MKHIYITTILSFFIMQSISTHEQSSMQKKLDQEIKEHYTIISSYAPLLDKTLSQSIDAIQQCFTKELCDPLTFQTIMQRIYNSSHLYIYSHKRFGIKKPVVFSFHSKLLFTKKSSQKIQGIIFNALLTWIGLMYIKYAYWYGNDTLFITFATMHNNQKDFEITPLQLAYYTLQSVSKTQTVQKNLFKTYSSEIIENLVQNAQNQANDLIDYCMKSDDDFDLFYVYETLSSLYKTLCSPNQFLLDNHYMSLKVEIESLFPATNIKKGKFISQLPATLETVLSSMAQIWYSLLLKKHVEPRQFIMLAYPNISLTVQDWMFYTACAGYTNISENKTFKQLIPDQYQTWFDAIPKKTRNAFTYYTGWFS